MTKFFSNIITFILLLAAVFFVLFLVKPEKFLKKFKSIINYSDYKLSDNTLSILKKDEVKTFSAADINEISAILFSENLLIIKENIREYTVELYGNWNGNYPSVNTEGKTLKIICKPVVFFSLGPRKIIVHVPENAEIFNDMNITCKSGNLCFENIESKNISVDSTSGSIKMKYCKFENSNLSSNSGSIHINDAEINNFNATATSGSLHFNGKFDTINSSLVSGSIHGNITAPLSGDSTFKTTSGSINLSMPEESSFKVDYKCTSGTFRNAFTGLSGGKKGSDIAGDGKINIKASTTSGSININRN